MSDQLRDCRLCRRCGYRAFTPSGDYGWVCSDDRACSKRAARLVAAGGEGKQ